jgi:hypothetical protein
MPLRSVAARYTSCSIPLTFSSTNKINWFPLRSGEADQPVHDLV